MCGCVWGWGGGGCKCDVLYNMDLESVNKKNYNNLLLFINLCLPIDVTLEKVVLNIYIWNLINSENELYGSIVKLSLCNNSTTLGENIRYCMYNYIYKIYDYEWYESINVIFKKIDSYMFCLVLMKMCSVMRSPSESYVSHVTHVMI